MNFSTILPIILEIVVWRLPNIAMAVIDSAPTGCALAGRMRRAKQEEAMLEKNGSILSFSQHFRNDELTATAPIEVTAEKAKNVLFGSCR